MCDSVVFRSDERRFLLAALAFVHTCSQGRHGFANSVAVAEISHEMTGSVSRSADAHCGTSQHVRPQAQRTFPGGVAAAARRVRRRTSGAAGRSGGCPVMTHRPRSVCRASGYRGFERRCFLFPTPSGATQEAASYTCPCAITRAGRANRGRAGSPALRAADRPRHVRTGADSASGGPAAPAVPVGDADLDQLRSGVDRRRCGDRNGVLVCRGGGAAAAAFTAALGAGIVEEARAAADTGLGEGQLDTGGDVVVARSATSTHRPDRKTPTLTGAP